MLFSESLQHEKIIEEDIWDFMESMADAFGISMTNEKAKKLFDDYREEGFHEEAKAKFFQKLLELANYINITEASENFPQRAFAFFQKYLPVQPPNSDCYFKIKRVHTKDFNYTPVRVVNGLDNSDLYDQINEMITQNPENLYEAMWSNGTETKYGLGDDEDWDYESSDFTIKRHPTDPVIVCYEKTMDKTFISQVEMKFLPHFSACFGENIVLKYLS